MPMTRVLLAAAIAGLLALAVAPAGAQAPAGGGAEAQPVAAGEDWIGALSRDRFTDATWRMAAGRATGDRGNAYEMRMSCRRDGARRDLETEFVVFDAERKPLVPEWDIDRRSGAALRVLRWRLDRQPASTIRAAPTDSDNTARIEDWSWRKIEMGMRAEERARRANADRIAFLAALRRGQRLLLGDLVEGEIVEFALPGAAAGSACPLCEVIDDCLRANPQP
ncbi:MAG: hypothetical protein ACKOGH_18035 [Alphaproteobacteria bacterium]